MIINTRQRFFIPELDGLRFIAFLFIFIHHASIPEIFILKEIKSIGWIGVDIFFCLSAFLLTRLLRYEIIKTGSVDVFHFFVRRILRIWPLYFAYTLLAFIFFTHANIITSANWFRLLGLITFTDNIFTAFNGFNPILFTGHLWTISYEEQFYLVLPFLIPWLTRLNTEKRVLLFVVFLMVGSAVRFISIYNNTQNPFIWVLPITHFESIMAGTVIGFYDYEKFTVNRILLLAVVFFSVVAIFILPSTDIIDYHLMIVYPCIGLASAGALCFLIHPNSRLIKKVLSTKVLVFAGKISFGLYVLHIACMNMVDYVFGIANPITNIFLSLMLTVVIASVSYIIFEKPFLLHKKKFTTINSRPV